MDNNIEWIENWYKQNCDGVWEHLYGVTIETLDNPGWSIKIDLSETQYENMQLDKIIWDKGDDWLTCWIKDRCFYGCGDPLKLGKIIEVFRNCVLEYDSESSGKVC